jgi:pyruvate formate lyase activating enzyme
MVIHVPLHVDPIEKKPLFHFFPGTKIYSLATSGCNFRCLNCQNWEISQTSPREADHYDLKPEDIVQQALQNNIKSLAFTYTEPTVFYEYLLDTAKIAHQHNLKTVLISNGYINEQPLLELCQYLDAANIDLKCFDDTVYHKLTGGRLEPVLNALKLLKAQDVWLEITNLLIPSYSDSPEMIQAMCNWLVANGFENTPLHFSRFFPNYKLLHISPTAVKTLLLAKEIAENAGIKYVYIGNIPDLENENTYCPNCKKLVVERSGYRVGKNLIFENKCSFCGEPISGIWE